MIIGHRGLRITRPLLAASLCMLCACGGSMNLKKSEQGISGTFITYGPPPVIADCGPLVTQAEKDSCKRDNERVIEEPFRSFITIRNLDTQESLETLLDPNGSFRVELLPGNYELCIAEECSDPLEVRMRSFTTYGQRRYRTAAKAKAPGPNPVEAPPYPAAP